MKPMPIIFDVLETSTYRKALLAAIPYAKKRIVITTMNLLWGKHTDAIFADLAKAAQRGVQIHIIYDAYSHLYYVHGMWPLQVARLHVKKTRKLMRELQELGVRVSLFGRIGPNPYRGRCHVKSVVIDDEAYSFGGINFSHQSFHTTDYMLHTNNSDVAECVAQLSERIATTKPPLPNGEVAFGQHHILFDGGRPKHSLIYDRACQLAAQATRIHFVSQMVPSGRLGRLLDPARDKIYYNSPLSFDAPVRWAQAFDEQRYRLSNHYRREKFIHAKCILFELSDGKRALLSGSHNFSYRGVAYGTQEVALYSTNDALWERLYGFIQKHIA